MNPYQGRYDEKGTAYGRWALHVVFESGKLRVFNLLGSEYEAQKARDSYLSVGLCAWVREVWLDSPDG